MWQAKPNETKDNLLLLPWNYEPMLWRFISNCLLFAYQKAVKQRNEIKQGQQRKTSFTNFRSICHLNLWKKKRNISDAK